MVICRMGKAVTVWSTGFIFWTTVLLNNADLALNMIKDEHQLAVAQDKNGETPLHVLARKPLAFAGGNIGLRRKIIRICKFFSNSWDHTLNSFRFTNNVLDAKLQAFLPIYYSSMFTPELINLRILDSFFWKKMGLFLWNRDSMIPVRQCYSYDHHNFFLLFPKQCKV